VSVVKSSRFPASIVAGAFAFGIPLTFYLAFPNRNYGWDAVEYVLQINASTAASLFHPHHLIYNPLGFVLGKALGSLGISVSTTTLMQTVNSLAAATVILLFFIILLRLSSKVITSLVFALLVAFSMGLWEYAIEVEVYVCGLVFLISSLLLIAESLSKGTEPKPHMLIGLGALGGLACLFHQMHILFVAVVFAFIYLVGKGLLPRLKMMAFYIAPFVLLVGGAYTAVGCALNKLPNLVSFTNWLTMYFQSRMEGYFALQNFPLAAYGLQKSFFRAGFFRDFLITSNIDIKGVVLLFLFGVGVILLVGLIIITISKFNSIYKFRSRLVVLLLVWILVYGVFTFCWDPLSHEFWMHILPPFWLLLFLGFEEWHFKKPRYKLALPIVLLCLLVCVNFAGDVLPNNNIENNEVYQLVHKLQEQGVTSGDLILIYGAVPIDNYYQLYFGSSLQVTSLQRVPSSVGTTKQAIFEHLSAVIESTVVDGGRVLVSESEISPSPRESLAFLGERRAMKVAEHPEFYAQYQDRLVRLFSYQWRKQEVWMFELTPVSNKR